MATCTLLRQVKLKKAGRKTGSNCEPHQWFVTQAGIRNGRLAASVDGLMFVLLIKEIKMIISECECCNEKRELEELIVESEMCGSCEEYNLGFVCKSCKENKGIVDELLKEYL